MGFVDVNTMGKNGDGRDVNKPLAWFPLSLSLLAPNLDAVWCAKIPPPLTSVANPFFLIWMLTKTQWAPVWMKLAVTSVLQHVGGIHSGCALSGAG
jgi:hypothetical protein